MYYNTEFIYFDNNATTRIHPKILKIFIDTSNKCFGNSSSIHSFGVKSHLLLDESRSIISSIFNCEMDEIIFTSGSTESNNIVINLYKQICNEYSTKLITSSMEHPSIYEPIINNIENYLFLNSTSDGYWILDNKILNSKLNLLTLIALNNETGILQDIHKVIELKNKYNVITHLDLTQVVSKVDLNDYNFKNIDFISISAHKFYGPKGIGVLKINKNIMNRYNIIPMICGGNQNFGLRSGTEDIPSIYSMCKAFEVIENSASIKIPYMVKCTQYLYDRLKELFDKLGIDYRFNIKKEQIINTISVSFRNINVNRIVKILSEKYNIFISIGSACSSNKKVLSRTLLSMGVDKKYVENTLRISLSWYNKKDQVDIFINKLENILRKKKEHDYEGDRSDD